MYIEAMNKKLETEKFRAQAIQKQQEEELEQATFKPKVNVRSNAKRNSKTSIKSSKKDDASDESGSQLREEHLFDDDVFRPLKDSELQRDKQKIQTNVAEYKPKPMEMQRFLDQKPAA